MAKRVKTPIFLNVTHSIDGDREYGRFETNVLVQSEPVTGTDTGIRNPSCGGFGPEFYNGFFLTDLQASAIYKRVGEKSQPSSLYDAIAYRRPYHVNESVATAMLKTLRRIDKGLKALRERDGYINEYAQFIFRLAEILGATVVHTTVNTGYLPTSTFTTIPDVQALRDLITSKQEK